MVKLTPPLGWNSWNTFGANISEELIKQTADCMVESGLLAAGYEYLVIDDCWSLRERDANDRLVADPAKFPNGMKAVADYVHRLCAFEGTEVRDVFLCGKFNLCGVSGQF